MKKFLFTFLIFLLTAETFSQSVTDLERDPSFKGITIGAPISKYSDILSFSHTSQGKNIYRVSQSSYLSIFDIRMENMIVVERNGKVYSILLTKTYSPDSQGACVFNPNILWSWYSNLRSRYGNNSFDLTDWSGTPAVSGMRWKANSVVLDIVYLFYGTLVEKEDEKPILIYKLYKREDDY